MWDITRNIAVIFVGYLLDKINEFWDELMDE